MNFSDCSILDVEFLLEMRPEDIVVSQTAVRLANVELIVAGAEGGADQLVAVAVRRPAARVVRPQFAEVELAGDCRCQPPVPHLGLAPDLPDLPQQHPE